MPIVHRNDGPRAARTWHSDEATGHAVRRLARSAILRRCRPGSGAVTAGSVPGCGRSERGGRQTGTSQYGAVRDGRRPTGRSLCSAQCTCSPRARARRGHMPRSAAALSRNATAAALPSSMPLVRPSCAGTSGIGRTAGRVSGAGRARARYPGPLPATVVGRLGCGRGGRSGRARVPDRSDLLRYVEVGDPPRFAPYWRIVHCGSWSGVREASARPPRHRSDPSAQRDHSAPALQDAGALPPDDRGGSAAAPTSSASAAWAIASSSRRGPSCVRRL